MRDVEGREYIDFGGGIGVMNIGHCHPKVVAAIKAQAEKFTHTCFMVSPYEVAIRLADKLCRVTPGSFAKKAVFVNSGAEAVENAVKIARYYTKRPAVVVFENAYHGRTLLTMTMTSKVKPYKFGFGPFAPEVYRMPFGDTVGPEKLKEFFVKHVNPEAVACVVAEPVQGEGGFIAPPRRLLSGAGANLPRQRHRLRGRRDPERHGPHRQDVRDRALECRARPGHRGQEPRARGCRSRPSWAAQEIMDSVHAGGLGGTYGANPLACAAALAVLEVFEEEDMLGKSRALGKKLTDRFEKWQKQFTVVGAIRGLGAMLGLTIVKGERPRTRRGRGQEARRLLPGARPHHPGLRQLQQRHPSAGPFVITDAEQSRKARESSKQD